MGSTGNDKELRSAKNLSLALGLLDSYWDKLSENLTVEQQSILSNELGKLEPRIKDSKDRAETDEEAKEFFEVFSQIEPLAFLSDLDESPKRGAALISPEDDVKIKILNYCLMLRKKIDKN